MSEVKCERCGKRFKDRRGLAGHRQHSNCGKAGGPAGDAGVPQFEALVPDLDRHRFVPKQVAATLARLDRLSAERPELPLNVKLVGPPGCGKSSLAEYFAAKYRRAFLDVNCGIWQDAVDAIGRLQLASTRTTFHLAAWVRFLEQLPGGVILLDELNRPESTKALNALYPLLDHRRSLWVQQEDRRVVRAPGTIIFAAINLDPSDMGLETLGDPMRDRWDHIRCDYPTAAQEARLLRAKSAVDKRRADQIVLMANALRKAKPTPVNISIRQTLRLSYLAMIDSDASLPDLVSGSIAHAFDDDYSQTVAQLILQAASAFDWAAGGDR